jgi:type III secretion system (T3SS) inner membrane Yop/YscD-like protein
MSFALTIAEGKGRGQRFRFDLDRVTIGRAAGNDVVLNHAAVSRVHARIERDGGAWVLLDRASANGVELNGAGIAGRAQLREGDRIAVGPVTFRFCLAPPEWVALRWWQRMSRPARSGLLAVSVILASIAALNLHLVEAPGGEVFVERNGIRTNANRRPDRGRTPRSSAGGDAVARAAYERGRRKMEERRIAPRNLYDAWQAFLEAQLALQGAGDQGQLAADLAELIAGCERDLRRQCDALSFRAARFDRYGQTEAEQRTWREALLHFPGDDPGGCRRRAQESLFSIPPDEGAG